MPGRKRVIRATQRDECRTAYVKHYEASSDFTFPRDFDLSRHDLLLAESIRNNGSTSVYLYWVSRERANALEPVVEKILAIRRSKVVGDVIQVVTPRTPKWTQNPVKWGKWLVAVAALFGALSVIRDHFTELFAQPDIIIFTGNSAAYNFHFGDYLDIPLEVRNQAHFGQSDIKLDAVRLRPSDGTDGPTNLQFNVRQIPQLQPGQNIEVHATGSSPLSQESQLKAYALEVQATAKGGFLWPSRKVSFGPYNLMFWPDRISEVDLARVKPAIARVTITLSTGVGAKSLLGQLTFDSEVPPESSGIALTSGAIEKGPPLIARRAADSIAKIQFQTDTLEPFHRYSYVVSIAFQQPLTESQWKNLASTMKATFE